MQPVNCFPIFWRYTGYYAGTYLRFANSKQKKKGRKNMQKKRTWDLIGVLLGVVTSTGQSMRRMKTPVCFSTSYASSAAFGADFYTYQYDATRIAADNAAVTANNIRELGKTMAHYAGFFFIAAGLLTLVHFGKNYFAVEDAAPIAAEDASAVSVPAPLPEEEPAAADVPEEPSIP